MVVDGNFSEPRWRRPVLALSSGGGVRLALIRCICSDVSELRTRQELRATSRWYLDHLSLPYRDGVDVYPTSVEQISDEEFPPGVGRASWHIDTGLWCIQSSIPGSDASIWEPLDLLLREWVARRGQVSLRARDV